MSVQFSAIKMSIKSAGTPRIFLHNTTPLELAPAWSQGRPLTKNGKRCPQRHQSILPKRIPAGSSFNGKTSPRTKWARRTVRRGQHCCWNNRIHGQLRNNVERNVAQFLLTSNTKLAFRASEETLREVAKANSKER